MQSRTDLKIINEFACNSINNFFITFIKFFSYFSAICLWNIENSLPNTPLTEKINGVKITMLSMFIIRLLYPRFFSFSCLSNTFSSFTLCCYTKLVLVIQTSKNAFWPAFHANPSPNVRSSIITSYSINNFSFNWVKRRFNVLTRNMTFGAIFNNLYTTCKFPKTLKSNDLIHQKNTSNQVMN